MAKLFVVATPLQMLVAQQVIRQEKITDAVLLQSTFSNIPDFWACYDVCRIDSLWQKKLSDVFDFPSWDNQGVKLLNTAFPTYKKYRKLRRILSDNNIDSIFLADFQNQTYRFMTVLFRRQGYNVAFYEEGYSHYVPRPASLSNGVVAKIKEWILDVFYYLPVYHIRFAYWRNNPCCPYNKLPISRRYSIIPGIHNESYDVRLYCKPMVSDKLAVYLKSEMGNLCSGKHYLFLGDPMSEVLDSKFRHLYYRVLKQALSKLDRDGILSIKFHPRETDQMKKDTLDAIDEIGIKYHVMSSKVNVPVEYFLLNIHFEEIFCFNTSTYFYNGYLFPKCKFHKLLPELLPLCEEANVPSFNLEQMKSLIAKMDDMRCDMA